MKVLIIIPAYNEELNIERVVSNLTENFPNYDYVVVNDGSKDNTALICKGCGAPIDPISKHCNFCGTTYIW